MQADFLHVDLQLTGMLLSFLPAGDPRKTHSCKLNNCESTFICCSDPTQVAASIAM